MTSRRKETNYREFQKVRPQKVSAIVAEQIVAAIQRGVFPVGSRLPSEAELAEQMEVSRPSIREALSALQAVKLIEAKPGSGNYVLKTPTSEEEKEAPHLIESEAGCLEVMEAREALEPPLARLAALNRTSKEVVRLQEIIGKMRTLAHESNFDSYFDADKEFHITLAETVKNRLISAALIPLINTMDQKLYREFTHHYYLKNVTDLEHVVDLHEEILEVIARGEPEMAFERMCEHWRRMREIWEA